MDTHLIQQYSPEWFAQRLGRATGSRIGDIIAKTKSGYSTSRANYAAQLVAERLTGKAAESYTNAAMQWGIDNEPFARAAYEYFRDTSVDLCGFVDHPTIPMSGASPDGTVAADGLVEFKCPITATHIETLLGASVPGKYTAQVQFQMACTGRQWCDLVSFDPRLPESMRLFVRRVHRDDKQIAEIEREVIAFLVEIDATVARLRDRYELREAA